MNCEITYTTDIYIPSPSDPTQSICVAKNKLVKRVIELEDVSSIAQHYTKKGNISKTKCQVVHEGFGTIIVHMPYEEMSKLKYPPRIQIKGFFDTSNQ